MINLKKYSALTLITLLAACNSGTPSNQDGQDTPASQKTSDVDKQSKTKAGNLSFGEMLPDFELSTLDGTSYRLHDLIDGEHYVAVVWHSPGCPCAAQCLDAIRDELSGPDYEDLEILGVASDPQMDVDWFRNDLQAQIDSGFVTFPVVLDHDQSVKERYGAKRTPTVWMADKEGKIQFWGAPESTLYPGSKEHRILIKEALLAMREGNAPPERAYAPIGCLISEAENDIGTNVESDQNEDV